MVGVAEIRTGQGLRRDQEITTITYEVIGATDHALPPDYAVPLR